MQIEYIPLAQVLGLFGLDQCWPWVCSVWPRYWVFSVWPSVGLGSVRSGPGLVLGLFHLAEVLSLFDLTQCWSVRSGPVLALGLFGLTQGDQGLFCLAQSWIRVCSVWTPLSGTQVRLAHTCLGSRTSSWVLLVFYSKQNISKAYKTSHIMWKKNIEHFQITKLHL